MDRPGELLDTDAVINASRISRLQIMVGVLGALILFVDGFNTQVIGYIAPQIAKNWNIPRDVLGWILAADKVGLLIGYLFVAPLSGYFGHKRVSIGCIVLFGLLAFLTTTADNTAELFILRLLTGIGLGGALPSGVALTGEYFPKHRRSTSITFIYCGLSFGQLSAGEVSNAVLQPFGWQAALWVGGALAMLLAAILAAILPESLEYLVNRGGKPHAAARILQRIDPMLAIPKETRLVAGERSGAKLTLWQLLPQLFQARRTFGTLVIWLALGMDLTVNTSLQVWLTKIMVDQGFDQHIAIIATEASFAAGIIGAFIIGPLMDRFGPYRVMSSLFVMGALFSIFLGLSLSWTAAGAFRFPRRHPSDLDSAPAACKKAAMRSRSFSTRNGTAARPGSGWGLGHRPHWRHRWDHWRWAICSRPDGRRLRYFAPWRCRCWSAPLRFWRWDGSMVLDLWRSASSIPRDRPATRERRLQKHSED